MHRFVFIDHLPATLVDLRHDTRCAGLLVRCGPLHRHRTIGEVRQSPLDHNIETSLLFLEAEGLSTSGSIGRSRQATRGHVISPFRQQDRLITTAARGRESAPQPPGYLQQVHRYELVPRADAYANPGYRVVGRPTRLRRTSKARRVATAGSNPLPVRSRDG